MKKPQALRVIQPSRACGGCTACCTALNVDEVQKSPLEDCRHMSVAGCGIYADRPSPCRAFDCGWRFALPALGLTDEDRPDKSGLVVFLVNPAFEGMTVHAAWPGATRSSRAKKLIGRLAKRGLAFVVFEGVNVEGVYAPPGGHPLVDRVTAMLKGEECSPAT